MRVCDLTTLFIDQGEGGVNTYLKEKAAYFERHRPDVKHVVVVPTARNVESQLGLSKLYGIASPRYFRNPQHRLLLNNRAIVRILRHERPDVVEFDGSSLLGRVAARALRDRRPAIVAFYHVHLATFFARKAGSPFGRMAAAFSENIAWRYTRHCLEPSDRIVVSSLDILRRLQDSKLGELVHIPLGVNTDLFRPGDNDNNNNNDDNDNDNDNDNGNGNGNGNDNDNDNNNNNNQ